MGRPGASKISRQKGISYAKWGYVFIAPFFIAYAIFHLAPQLLTIYNSFFENYREGLTQVGPNFVGLKNYITLFTPDANGNIDILKYAGNTVSLWIGGAVPQIVVALLLAIFFTSYRLKIKGQAFFKAVIYLPNLIMASAFSMLFFTLFSNVGPVNQLLIQMGWSDHVIDFFALKITVRSLICLMNFLMWFGNTTIMLMAAIMGINPSIFEAAELDGCTHIQKFFRITLPQIKPLLTYTLITSLIGGLQMFDVPQILTGGKGAPDRTTMTLIMYLNKHLQAKNYGIAVALSVFLFIISAILCWFVFKMNTDSDPDGSKSAAKRAKKGGKA